MKRLSMTLICVMLIVGVGLTVNAATVDNGRCGDAAFWSLDDAGTLCIFGEGEMYSYYVDTGAGTPWSNYQDKDITSIVIEEGITKIGESAFGNCLCVTSVSIPTSVTEIGDYAFGAFNSLKEITIPGNVKRIGDGNFWGNTGFKTIDGERVYYRCSLETIVLSEGIEQIGEDCFRGAEHLRSIHIPASVISVGRGAFSGTSNLLTVTVAEQNENYCAESGVLYNKQKTELLVFPSGKRGVYRVADGVEKIATSAFYNPAVTCIILPEGVTTIESHAFRKLGPFDEIDNKGLSCVVLPTSVTSIEESAFDDQTHIIYMGTSRRWESVWNKDDYDRDPHEKLTCSSDYYTEDGWSLENGVLTVSAFSETEYPLGATPWFRHFEGIEEIVIGDGIIEIPHGAFQWLFNVKRIRFPVGLESIGEDVFNMCGALTSVFVPDSVTTIGEGAFCGCESLVYCHLPQSLSVVSRYLFGGCSALQEIVIPNQVTEIKEGAFYNSSLHTIALPLGIQKIEDLAFYSCPIETVYYLKSADKRDLYEIAGKWREDDLLYADLYGAVRWSALDENDRVCEEFEFRGITYRFYDGETAKVYAAPGIVVCDIYPLIDGQDGEIAVTAIGPHAIGSATKKITIPSSIKTIEKSAFSNCTDLEEVWFLGTREEWENIVIGEDNVPLERSNIIFVAEGLPIVEENGILYYLHSNYAEIFGHKTDLSGNAVIPDEVNGVPVTLIAKRSFASCNGLTGLILGNNIEKIGSDAFILCVGLNNVSLPNGLKEIGKAAFSGCRTLKSIIIPEGTELIGQHAFRRCESLESVFLPESLKIIGQDAFFDTGIVRAEYAGSSENWEGVSVAEGNEELLAVLTKNDGVRVSGVSLDKTTLALFVGENDTLTATITPFDAYNKEVVWESSNNTVVTVENGLVTAIGEGGAVITVKSKDGGYYDSCEVTASYQKFEGVTFNGATHYYDATEKGIVVNGVPAFATVTYTNNKGTDVGEYPAKAVIKADGYTTLEIEATLKILPKELTITDLSAQCKVYDGTNTATVSGGELDGVIAGDDVSAVMPTIGIFEDENAAKNVSVILEPIMLSGCDAGNYILVQPTGLRADIAKRTIKVKADNHEVFINQPIPSLTYQITEGNLVDGDLLTGALSVNANTSVVRDYVIQKGTLSAGVNYNLVFVEGTLSVVAKLRQSIGFEVIPAKTYGDDPFSLVVTPDETSHLSAFTYASSDSRVATVSDEGVVTILCAGTTTITVGEPGNHRYAACDAAQVLTVNKKGVTITALDIEKKTATLTGILESDAAVMLDFDKVRIDLIGDVGESVINVKVTDFLLNGERSENYKVLTEEFISFVSSANVATVSLTAKNGTVTGDGVYYKGETVTLTATPDRGYFFDGWYEGSRRLSTKTSYSFTINENMSITAKFTVSDGGGGGGSFVPAPVVPVTPPAIPAEPEINEWVNPFKDVRSDVWYKDSVCFVVEKGLMKGASETAFEPDATLSRAMLVTILYRHVGEPEIKEKTVFSDVTSGAYYENAIAWAKENGIVSGVSEVLFAPEESITREQIATIIYRFAKLKGYDVDVVNNADISSYQDSDSISAYAKDAFSYVVGSGLLKGKTATTLNPQDVATRAEMATILKRFIEMN